MKAEVPFKTKVGGVKCITIIRQDSILVDFTEYKRTAEILHSNIRCIQQRGRTVLVNTQNGDRLLTYLITTPSSKKLYDVIIDSMSC